MKRALLCIVALPWMLSCSESTAPAVGPTTARLLSASGSYVGSSGPDRVTVRVHNDSGPGEYVLEFWSHPTATNLNPRTAQSAPVTVLQGYDETITVEVPGIGEVQTVKAKSRATNTAVYRVTDCRVVRQTSYCQ